MKKMFLRVLAFAFDMFFVSAIVYGLSNISFLNPNKGEITQYYQELEEIKNEYDDIESKMDEYVLDNVIDATEYGEIRDNYHFFVNDFYDIEQGETFDDDTKNNLVNSIEDSYNTYTKEYNYNINKLNVESGIVTLIVYILYFGVLEWYLKGQTIFKKLFRLRTISLDGKDIPLWKFIIKCILITEAIFTILNIIFVNCLGVDAYTIFSNIMYYIEFVYEVVFVIACIIRDDQRSVHDLLLNTRIALYDKNNKEVESILFKDEEDINKVN